MTAQSFQAAQAHSLRTHNGITPKLGANVYIEPSAIVLGDVELGADSSVWPYAVIRGDMHQIRIGQRCSIQDGCVLHITHRSKFHPDGFPLTLGDDVTVGHQATLHGCTIGSRVLIGIKATVMDGAVVEDDVIVGAHAFVPPGKRLVSGFVYAGCPAKALRPITEAERELLVYGPENYVRLKNQYVADAQH